ncbi:universal stress protein [Arthrobacter agilis]|uniref:universal stress protein n=1 Tax=Arthrobacter agilis TaxID=37921 RepID=UPI0027877921|nr:universal stress protein [Arthrobacter agilis]MDQ0735086.1 nucleotide-binding universal stress UspA family protein [Arthrobacter agilis]
MNPPGVPAKPVIVGYDGSDGSRLAVQWAAHHAAATGLGLVVVHCWVWPFFTQDLGPVPTVKDSGLRSAAQRIAAEGLGLARQAEPDVDTSERLIVGFPSEVLTRLSVEASLLVTGTRGLGGFAGLLIGSVSLHLAAAASCPIAVIRDDQPANGDVLVAVDGSPESDRAVIAAASLATTLHAQLRILHVRPYSRHVAARLADLESDPVIQQALNLLPGDTDLTVIEDSFAEHSVPGVIVHHTRGAMIVVLGAKGNNTLGARLGSTVHAVLHHAQGSVLVVR